jgi:hypothetical protein
VPSITTALYLVATARPLCPMELVGTEHFSPAAACKSTKLSRIRASTAQHRAPVLDKPRSIERCERNVKLAHSSQDEGGFVIEPALARRPVMLIRNHDIGHPVEDSVH